MNIFIGVVMGWVILLLSLIVCTLTFMFLNFLIGEVEIMISVFKINKK